MLKPKTIAISGYFIWLHIGHTEYIKKAKKYGKVIAILNNDSQQILKYGKVIVPLKERIGIIKAIKYVDEVVASIDTDRTVCKTLEWLKPDYFGNGGDRTNKNIPEVEVCEQLGIQLIFGLGEKKNSSSQLLNNDKNTIHQIKRTDTAGVGKKKEL